MHILFICQTFPEPNNQRKGIFYRDQAIALQKAGHQVGVIALGGLDSMDLSREGLRNWQKQVIYTDSGFPVYRTLRVPLPLKRRDTRLRLWSITSPAVRTANRYIAMHGVPDILHSQNFFYAGLTGIRIARENGLPHVLTEHSSLFLYNLRDDKLRLLQNQLPKIHCTLAVSTALADRIRSYVPGKEILVVGNVVNTDIFAPGKGEKLRYPFTFTIAARLDRNKSVGVALRAFHQAFAGKKNLRMVICGDGPEKENLVTLTDKLDVNKQVDFLSFLPREELITLYQRSHVGVSSSHSETFGLTLTEAMACGLPVIATRSGGPEDIVTDKAGLLVDTDSVESMSKAMQKMYQHYNEYQPEKIRAYCIRNYSEQAFVKKLVNIYKEEMNWALVKYS